MITSKKPKIILNIKNKREDIFKKITKKEIAPNNEPKTILFLLTFLFKIIEIPKSKIKSNKKFIKKT